jgi:hypothetical protein
LKRYIVRLIEYLDGQWVLNNLDWIVTTFRVQIERRLAELSIRDWELAGIAVGLPLDPISIIERIGQMPFNSHDIEVIE